ncbi:MAG: helix-turn-helix domain-containing protein [Phaeodactylibacter sp.]|nr:helix-turn-helix domain-containing protein [Phaeodactylibacter sp.]
MRACRRYRPIWIRRILWAAYLSLLATLPAHPQQQAIRLEQLTANDGLPGESIHALHQDRLGLLWAGTITGLLRYDGYEKAVYTVNERHPQYAGRQNINAITETEEGTLWIAANKIVDWGSLYHSWIESAKNTGALSPQIIPDKGPGLFRFSRNTDTFIAFRLSESAGEGAINHIITTLFIDRRQQLWIGTAGGGLYRLGLKSAGGPEATLKHYVHDSKMPGSLPSNIIHGRLMEDEAGYLWIPTHRGLCRFDHKSGQFHLHPFFPGSVYDPRNHCISAIAQRKCRGRFWVGALQGGVFDFNPADGTFRQYRHDPTDPHSLPSNLVSTLLEDQSGKLWVGSGIDADARLSFFDPATGRFTLCRDGYSPNAGIQFYGMLSALEDQSGVLWFGARGTGLFKYNPRDSWFHFLKAGQPDGGIKGRYLSGVCQGRDGSIWISTENEGFYRWNREQGQLQQYHTGSTATASIRHDRVTGVLEDQQGYIWIGHKLGLERLDPETNTVRYYDTEAGSPENRQHVLHILESRQGQLWVATWGAGIYRLDDIDKPAFSNFKFQGQASAPQSINNLYKLVEGPSGMLWACSRGGLLQFDPRDESFELFYTEAGVKDMAVDRRGNLWLASANNNGLVFVERKTKASTHLTAQLGLRNVPVRGLILDDNQQLWAVSAKGISLIDTDRQAVVKHFDYTKWTDDKEHWTHTFMRAFKNDKGELFFTSRAGLLSFHPDSIRENRIPPKVVFTDFRLFNESVEISDSGPLRAHISAAQRLELKHWQNDLSFTYAAPHFAAPENNRFAYKLVNYDEEWRQAGNQRTAVYTNLSPGKYTMKVKAANGDGYWNEEGASIAITIYPPWWRTGWASALWIVLAAGLLYGLYYFQLNRRLAQAEARRLQELDQMKTRFYTNITHEFRTPLTIILGLAEQMKSQVSGRLKDKLQIVGRNGRQLLRLVNELLDLSKLESGQLKLDMQQGDIINYLQYLIESFHSLAADKNIQIHFLSEIKEFYMDYDPARLTHVMSNLLSNAIQYAPEGKNVYVLADEVAGRLQIKVRDTGIGIPEDKLPFIFERFYSSPSQSPSLLRKASASEERGKVGADMAANMAPSPPPLEGVRGRLGLGGAGIGLALTKELVQLMGGEITVRSELGKGSEFTVTLPVTRKKAIQTHLPAVAAPDVPSSPINELPSPEKGKPLLLIVEDNPDLVRFLIGCFNPLYRLEVAYNGRQGIDKALALIPDIVITDVMMPEKDGFELCNTLKNHKLASHIPIIMLTARADVDSRLTGLRQGADAYLDKPFLPEELKVRIRMLLEQRRKLQAYYRSAAGLSEEPASFAPDPAVSNQEKAFLANVNGIIEAHLDDSEFTVNQLCRALFVDPSNLYRKLAALTGMSPSRYIRSFRLAKARKLLAETSLPIASVARECGFADQAYFSRVFKREYGMPPTRYRSRNSR